MHYGLVWRLADNESAPCAALCQDNAIVQYALNALVIARPSAVSLSSQFTAGLLVHKIYCPQISISLLYLHCSLSNISIFQWGLCKSVALIRMKYYLLSFLSNSSGFPGELQSKIFVFQCYLSGLVAVYRFVHGIEIFHETLVLRFTSFVHISL